MPLNSGKDPMRATKSSVGIRKADATPTLSFGTTIRL